MKNRDKAIDVAKKIFETRYNEAIVIFCAGSYIREEATSTSDIDLVVLFPKLEQARRESFIFDGWPVEAFVHDPETLRYFITEIDIPSGIPSLPNMVLEGVQVPQECPVGNNFKHLVRDLINKGPAQLTNEQDLNIRYSITDLVDDLRAPRSRFETIVTGTRLFEVLAGYYLRSNNKWSAYGKTIPKRLKEVNKDFAKMFDESFEELFSTGQGAKVISLAHEVLSPNGGFIFDGYKRTAPKEWRSLNSTEKCEESWSLGKHTLPNGKTLTIIQPGPEMACDIVDYVNQVGGESDNLTFGANQFNISVKEESELLKKNRDSGFNLMVSGIVDGKVVSVGSLSRNSRDRLKHLAVLGISVLKDFWGQGIAKLMMEAMISWAKSHGVTKIDLKVKSDNIRAIAIYEKLGFAKEGIHPHEVFIDGKYHDYISMGLYLES